MEVRMGMVFRVYLLYLYRRFWLMVNLNYVIESQWERAPPITPSLMFNGVGGVGCPYMVALPW